MDPLSTTVLEWFKSHNGKIDEEHMGLAQIQGCGTGAIALKDIPVSPDLLPSFPSTA